MVNFSDNEKISMLRELGWEIVLVNHKYDSPGYQNTWEECKRERYEIPNSSFNWHPHLFKSMDQVDYVFDQHMKQKMKKLFLGH